MLQGLKVGGVKMKKNEKKCVYNLKKLTFFTAFLGWSLGFAFQR
jgi:hypothetical protein